MSSSAAALADVAAPRALAIIGALYAVSALVSALLAAATGAPFVPWFRDTPLLLGAMLALLLLMGIAWDGSLVSIGLVADALRRRAGRSGDSPLGVVAMRARRFFSCGPAPIAMLLATAVAILGTSNITLLNLELLSHSTRWRDPFFWRLEGGVLERVAALPIDTAAWDRLYHSAWGIELFAAFALVVIGRGSRIVLHYCVTMIVLFYVGRLLGVLNPVMGPAFYRPEVFAYLDGSVTADAMRMVAQVMASPPERAVRSGGILLGGVSAMPSLHVAMVAVTAYWLARAARWTLWITAPWVALVWMSTVVLGWHYIIDGAGGIALGAACVWLAVRLLRACNSPVTAARATAATRAGLPAASGIEAQGRTGSPRPDG